MRFAAPALRHALVALAFVATGAAAQPDTDFLAAKAAFDRGDARALAALAPKLDTHPLAPYVEYWRLRVDIDAADPDAIRAYLTRYPDTPLADRLRVDWLKSLAKRGDWARFAADYPPPSGEDTELACFAVQWKRQRDGDAALAAARGYWFTGQSSPPACEPLFDALIAKGTLTPADVRARFRLALEAGNPRLAQLVATALPAAERITPQQLANVERDPPRALARAEFNLKQSSGRELALYALDRAARKDAGDARGPWVRLRDRLPEADRLYGNARLAYHAARQLEPAANDWYNEARGATLTDEQHAWHVRAALRAQSWRDVLAATEAMPAPLAQEPAWRYWKARALDKTGRADEARAAYEPLAREFHYYGVLAAEALGRPIQPRSDPVTATPAALAWFGDRAGVRRVVKLAELDLRQESFREWVYAIRGLDDERLLIAAEFARREGLYDRAINTADRTAQRHDFALRYLAPYRDQFAAAAKDHDVDESLILSVARQESRFSPTIVSSAGATGLMQLMPATARWIAKQLGRSDFRPARIADVDLNTSFGAFYFKYCLDKLDGRPALAAAAYNAGPQRAQAWRPPAALEGAIWVETIPFNETRDYVKKVLSNAVFYAHALNRPAVSLTERLGTVTPRGASPDALATRAD